MPLEMNPLDKAFKLPREKFKELIAPMGGCIASDRILVDGAAVGYMSRETPTDSVASGWTFMAGDEDQDYADNPDNWAIYEVNTICNYDPTIIPYLDSRVGTAWGKDIGAKHFQEEPMPQEPKD
jgi:hypothetical protein